jgi:acylphosphatase
MKHLNITVFGSVQGVFFRSSTLQKASELGICGFVRNQPNGCVYIEAEGEEEALNQFVTWCHQGPDSAQVDRIEVKDSELSDLSAFEIRH